MQPESNSPATTCADEQARALRAQVWRFIFDCYYAKQKAAGPGEGREKGDKK